MIIHYVSVDTNDIVQGSFSVDSEAGDSLGCGCIDGERLEEVDVPFVRDNQSPTAIARLVGRAVVWEEVASIDELRQRKVDEMNLACRNCIFAGFKSSALGVEYTYPAKTQDQANLIGSVTDSIILDLSPDWRTPFWCEDADGVWAFRLHTAEQIQRVGRDGKTAILTCMTINEGLRAQIMTATAEELDAIVWPM